jgi:integrase
VPIADILDCCRKQKGRLAAAYRKFDQRQRADRYNNIGPPKSDSSVRTIPLDREAMVPALKEWKLKCPPSDFVFPTSTGRIEHHANMLRGLEPIMVKSGVIEKGEPKYALHAFRHFFASWCINPKARGGRELPPKQVQYLLGHSTISMTFDIYGHFPERREPGRANSRGAPVACLAPRKELGPRWNGVDPAKL